MPASRLGDFMYTFEPFESQWVKAPSGESKLWRALRRPKKSVQQPTPQAKKRPPPQYLEMPPSLCEGSRIRLTGMVLEKPLPGPERLSAIHALFARDETDQGQLSIYCQRTGTLILTIPVETHRGGQFQLSGRISPSLPAGAYRIQWTNREGQALSGEGRMRVLAEDYAGVIVTSDIDQTYLSSDIHSRRGLWKLMRQPVQDKRALPGMVTLLQSLRQSEAEGLPLVFLSASPTFFAPVFAARLTLHEIPFDGLLLKPFDAVIKRELARSNVKGALRALKEQLSYKLNALLEQRQYLPIRARELLLGDDTEVDALTFELYRELLAGRLSLERLADALLKHGVEWYKLEPLVGLARATLKYLSGFRPEVLVCIRRHASEEPIAEEPSVFWHRDSIALAEQLIAQNLLSSEAIKQVQQMQLKETPT